MYSSYSLSKYLVYVPILAIQLFICSVSSLNLTNDYLNHKCLVSQGKYKPGGKYEDNLNMLIRDASTYTYANGFLRISYGKVPNFVRITLQCRGDTHDSKCLSCYDTALSVLRRRCQRDKGGMIWYDQCFLSITSKDSPFPRRNDYKNIFSMHNPNNMSEDEKLSNKEIRDYLYGLMWGAKNRDNKLLFSSGEKPLEKKKLYAMVQCAYGIFQCKACLEWSIRELAKCCDGKQGARVLGSDCYLRYELYPFLRESPVAISHPVSHQ